ncbi:cytochrome b/b6 domain-containing protein [Rhodoferax sp.]|uniref:cytochrome b/b6 domain-containing protein n=1 Tax=Rhodoferax sp. TaxID=50421 RepID=UPI0025EE72BB|nr:cytochrome b/b6 domain-containing protein [Rhodoferax sp.]MCM2342572.1 cytochrome b/b6 domain-containing protein [Rhodoferax sp.]
MAVIVRVWDAPTRLFHWTLSLCVVGLFVTSQVGGAAMDWHFRFGYGVLTLLLFRFVWGVYGGHWSRFSTFVVGPRKIWRYLQGQGKPQDSVGHNPLGALSVVTMLALLSLQVASGLISDDEIAAAGPLVRFVSSTWIGNATFYHTEIGKFILLGLVALHLGAIAFYYFRKHDDLIISMITGDKSVPIQAPSTHDGAPERRRAGLIFLACAALVSSLVIGLNG